MTEVNKMDSAPRQRTVRTPMNPEAEKVTMTDLEDTEDFDSLEAAFPDFDAMEDVTVGALAASPNWTTVADFTAVAVERDADVKTISEIPPTDL